MNFVSGQAQYESLPGPADSAAGEGAGGRGGTNIQGLPLTMPPYWDDYGDSNEPALKLFQGSTFRR